MTAIRVAPLAEQTVAITGGTSGIGLETARQLAAEGVPRLVLVGRDPARGRAAVEAVQAVSATAEVVFLAGDVASPDTSERLAALLAERFEGVDSLVTAAGGGSHLPRLLHELPREDAKAILDEWLLGTILAVHAILPLLRRRGGGAIVTVASDAGKVATPGESVIGAAMAGILMFTRTVALEAARSGIRANCLTPSIVQGTRTYDFVMSDPFAVRLFGKAHERARLGVATPADQAALIRFLIGPDSARLTGQAISVNGGISVA